MIGIYKIENLINHKKYIGKTINIYKRFGDHKRLAFYESAPSYEYPLYKAFRKYGLENFDFSIIEECEESELDTKEKYWIQFYNAYGKNGYNQTPGGDGVPKVSHKKAISMYKSGRSIEEIADYFQATERTVIEILHSYNLAYLSQDDKNKLQNPRTVYQYDLNGNFIQEYYSAGDAARKLHIIGHTQANSNSILRSCNNCSTAYGFLWTFNNDNERIKAILNTIKNNQLTRLDHVSQAVLKKCSKPVNQYDLNGKYLKSYASASEARRTTGNQHICDICNGKLLTAAKYYWRYTSEEFPKEQNLDINNIQNWRKQMKNKNSGGGG